MGEDVIYVDENNNQVPAPRGAQTSTMSYPPTQMRGEKAEFLDKIKPDAIVETIRHRLMGEDLVNGKWVSIPALKDRALTSVGAWDIANLMLGASSQNVSLSKLNDMEIRNRALSIATTAQKMALKNWKEYGIKGVDQFYFINEVVFTNTFITLKQNEGGGLRKLVGEISSESKVITSNEQPQRRGLLRLKMR